MIELDFLGKTNIFKGLDSSQLRAIQAFSEERSYHKGDKIFAEGESSTHLGIVSDGQVDLRFDLPGRPTSEKNTISSVKEGMMFLWSSLVPPHITRLSSYCVSGKCKVLLVDASKLLEFFEKDPKAGFQVMTNLSEVMGERFHRLQDEIANRRGHEVMFNW